MELMSPVTDIERFIPSLMSASGQIFLDKNITHHHMI